MPKKKPIPNDEPLSSSRPQRNMKAKIVFDPSDNYLPKRRNKKLPDKKKSPEKVKHIPIDALPELPKLPELPELPLIDNSSNDINTNTISPVNTPPASPVRSEIIPDASDLCCICSTNTPKGEFLDCAVCLMKTHRDCLLINEPMWKFKLDTGPWLCTECRKIHCSKCLKDESESKLECCCITCKVGLHVSCYDSYEIKPLHPLGSERFICIPCMTLATQKVPEVEEDLNNAHSANVSYVTSEEDDDLISTKSNDSSIGLLNYGKNSPDTTREFIPDVTKWDKFEVYNYLSQRLPIKTTTKILENDIDGCALHLLKRKDITMNMNLTLGHALHFYKEVRILQAQSTFPAVYWE